MKSLCKVPLAAIAAPLALWGCATSSADTRAAAVSGTAVEAPDWAALIPESTGPNSGQMPPYVGDLPIRSYESPDYCEADKRQIRVSVENISARGILVVEAYGSDPDLFLEREGRVRRVRVPAEDGPQTVCFTLAQDAPFAVAVYHDRNGNRKVDKNFLGIPKESLGLSNNPKLRLAKPKYSEAKIDLPDSGVDLSITLQKY